MSTQMEIFEEESPKVYDDRREIYELAKKIYVANESGRMVDMDDTEILFSTCLTKATIIIKDRDVFLATGEE